MTAGDRLRASPQLVAGVRGEFKMMPGHREGGRLPGQMTLPRAFRIYSDLGSRGKDRYEVHYGTRRRFNYSLPDIYPFTVTLRVPLAIASRVPEL